MSNPNGRITHGFSKTRLYKIYAGIKTRCYNPAATGYSRYGGRGILMEEDWYASFGEFKRWAESQGYRDDLTIDRIDNDGPYSPDNCRWVTNKANCRNSSVVVKLTAFGETKSMSDWAEDSRCQCSYYNLRGRIAAGWDAQLAISTPTFKPGLKRRDKAALALLAALERE